MNDKIFDPNLSQCRLNYHDLLVPEVGFKLEKAITTTYSMDIETVMASFLSLGLDDSMDSELLHNPISLLYAIKSLSKKVLIFCDSSQIKCPKSQNHLIDILEGAFIPVSLPPMNGKQFPSFHPKTWLLEYVNEAGTERKYRFIVLSRNLTTDRSWDVALCLNGDTQSSSQKKTEPLIDFIKFLKKQIQTGSDHDANRNEILNSFIKRLKEVSFKTEDSDFSDFAILPIGIGKELPDMDNILFSSSKQFKNMTVMSPFISKGTIQELSQKTKNPVTLITRRYELGKIQGLTDINVYCLKEGILNADIETEYNPTTDEVTEHTFQSDIHAKIYSLTGRDANYLYLGSMNASYYGAHRNVEMLLRLKSSVYGPHELHRDLSLSEEMESAFEKVEIEESYIDLEEDEKQIDFETIVKGICRMSGVAHVEQEDGKTTYKIILEFSQFQSHDDIEIYPLFAPSKCQAIKSKLFFENLQLTELSSFYVIKSGDFHSLIIIQTNGIPEERDKKIITSVISNKRKLSEYIALILGMRPINDLIEDMMEELEGALEEGDNPKKKRKNHRVEEMYPIYEKMLSVSYQDPSRLKEIGDLIEMIDDIDIIPQDFRNLYKTFKEATEI